MKLIRNWHSSVSKVTDCGLKEEISFLTSSIKLCNGTCRIPSTNGFSVTMRVIWPTDTFLLPWVRFFRASPPPVLICKANIRVQHAKLRQVPHPSQVRRTHFAAMSLTLLLNMTILGSKPIQSSSQSYAPLIRAIAPWAMVPCLSTSTPSNSDGKLVNVSAIPVV